MKERLLIMWLLACFYFSTTISQAQDISGKHLVNQQNVALSGYDLVGYFEVNQAIEGSANYSTQYKGVSYHFSNEQHLKYFQADPEHYLPKYGGYCSWAMGKNGTKVPSNPMTFKFVDGELHFFFNGQYKRSPFNALEEWNKEEAYLKPMADINWKLLHPN